MTNAPCQVLYHVRVPTRAVRRYCYAFYVSLWWVGTGTLFYGHNKREGSHLLGQCRAAGGARRECAGAPPAPM